MKDFGTRLKELVYEDGAAQRIHEYLQNWDPEPWHNWDVFMELFLEHAPDDLLDTLEGLFQDKDIVGLLIQGVGVVACYQLANIRFVGIEGQQTQIVWLGPQNRE